MNDETSAGCQHREHEGATRCNKLCDPDQTLCPFHKLLLTSHGRPKDGPVAERMREATRPLKTPRGYQE